jgi:glycogen(starch) synthase
VFANALLLQLSRWFDLTIVAQTAVNPAEALAKKLVIMPPTEKDKLPSHWVSRELDLSRFSLIYNLGGTSFSSLVTRLVADLMPGVPLVNHFQIVLSEYARHEGWGDEEARYVGLTQQFVAERACKNIFISSAELSRAIASGWKIGESNNYIIPNAFVDAGAEPRIARQEACSFLAAGRFSDYVKGADLLYRAFLRVHKRHPSARLDIASDERRFLDILRPLPADSWRFLGWLSREELHSAMSAANAVVMPSRYEPFGLVALEAMAMGTPVIAMAVGGLAEIIDHGNTGWLCPPNEGSLGLSFAMNVVADDLSHAKRIGANAQKAIKENFRMKRIAQLVRLHLDNALVASEAKNPLHIAAVAAKA